MAGGDSHGRDGGGGVRSISFERDPLKVPRSCFVDSVLSFGDEIPIASLAENMAENLGTQIVKTYLPRRCRIQTFF